MNCSPLKDDDYFNDVTVKIPIWLAEGRNELSNNRSILGWIKWNIEHMQFSNDLKPGPKENNDLYLFDWSGKIY